MAKKVIRYLLEGNGSIPLFVEDGGYFPVGAEMVGVSVDTDERHMPGSVHVLDLAELTARVVGLEIREPMSEEPLDEAAKITLVESWLAERGIVLE